MSVSEADDAEVFKKVVEQTASAEALLAVHNAQNMASKMTSISINGAASRIDDNAASNYIQTNAKVSQFQLIPTPAHHPMFL
jgi:hypothetical protein